MESLTSLHTHAGARARGRRAALLAVLLAGCHGGASSEPGSGTVDPGTDPGTGDPTDPGGRPTRPGTDPGDPADRTPDVPPLAGRWP